MQLYTLHFSVSTNTELFWDQFGAENKSEELGVQLEIAL
jgi:hypothetical protein